jgi:hypothetical protein
MKRGTAPRRFPVRWEVGLLILAVVLTAINLLVMNVPLYSTSALFVDTAAVPANIFETADGFGYFFHAETTSISGTSYYQMKKHTPGDGPATTISASFQQDQPGRVRPSPNEGKFVYPLTGVSEIPASTWYVTYRVQRSSSRITVHADIDILIRRANGAVRTTLATEVANSADIGGKNKWESLTATYSFPGYTVAKDTDFLEIEVFIHATSVDDNATVDIRLDDSSLQAGEQTRVREDFS